MSSTATDASPVTDDTGSHQTDHHGHDPFLAHHFETPQQQFDAGKLGMWLFLVTEVLFFSGLFVAYVVYRSNHPEVFANAHTHLNTTLGAVNTIVLLLSSLTMAWAVRSAQLGNLNCLRGNLVATLACAGWFLGIKAVEYGHKWDEGILWGARYAPHPEAATEHEASLPIALLLLSSPAIVALVVALGWAVLATVRKWQLARRFSWSVVLIAGCFFGGVATGQIVTHYSSPAHATTHPDHDAATGGDRGHAQGEKAAEAELGFEEEVATGVYSAENQKKLTGIFFSIYYAMTGVHAIHILAGMAVLGWLLWRSLRGDFGPQYFGPVDYVGLYWHLVDLVWIYLFPLLYLIR